MRCPVHVAGLSDGAPCCDGDLVHGRTDSHTHQNADLRAYPEADRRAGFDLVTNQTAR